MGTREQHPEAQEDAGCWHLGRSRLWDPDRRVTFLSRIASPGPAPGLPWTSRWKLRRLLEQGNSVSGGGEGPCS